MRGIGAITAALVTLWIAGTQAQTIIVPSCTATGLTYTAGQTGRPIIQDVNGNQCIAGTLATAAGTAANNADAVATSTTGLGSSQVFPYLFNGTTFDRWRGDATNGGFVNVKVLPSLVAGSAIVGKVGIDQTTPGTTNLVAAGQSGTWTVQPGNTANTTPWLVTPGQTGATTTMATAAPTAATFSSILASNAARKACSIQNTSPSVAYVYFGTTGSATTANSYQVAVGQMITCTNNNITLTDNVAATCASGTCAFIIASQ